MTTQLEFSIPSSLTSKKITFDFSFNDEIRKQPLVIFLHGFKGFKDWGHFNLIAQNFASQGFNFIKMNFSHNGTNEHNLLDFVDLEAFGNNNFTKELTDVNDLLDYIFTNKKEFSSIDLENITLIGHSKGGATALIKGINDSRINKVITWSGVIHLKERYAAQLEYWGKEGVIYVENSRTNQQLPLYYQLAEDVLSNEIEYNIPQLLKTNTKPCLAIHSKEDQTVLVDEPLSVKDHFTEIEILESGSHTFDGSHPYLKKQLPEVTLKALSLSQNFIKA